MKNYHFFPQLFLRTPRFCKDTAQQAMSEILQDKNFQKALYLSSDVVYNEVKKLDFNWHECSKPLQHTLYKYLIRMCYRSTPFGASSSLSLCDWGNSNGNNGLTIKANSFITLQHERTEKRCAPNQRTYQLNPTLYPFGKIWRYFERLPNEDAHTIQLSDMEGMVLPAYFIRNREKLNHQQMLLALEKTGMSKSIAKAYLNDLLKEQILIETKLCHKITTKLTKLLGYGTAKYAQTFHQTIGEVPSHYQHDLSKGLHALQILADSPKNHKIATFTKAFFNLFEHRQIPLLEALDPEIGLDYHKFSHHHPYQHEEGPTPVQRLIIQKILHHVGKQSVLVLTESDLRGFEKSTEQLPPGLTVLFSIINGQLFIREASSSCATAITARFSVFHQEMANYCRNICDLEQKTNPNTIFADILHEAEPNYHKLSWTANLSKYQIPLLVNTNPNEARLLPLHDLYLGVESGELILRSKKLKGKRVIPRMNNAYNFQRSDFSIFKFLGDLSLMSLGSCLSFDLKSLLPDLQVYPRVVYEGVVISAACWVLTPEQMTCLRAAAKSHFYITFLAIAKAIKLPENFMVENGDQNLVLRLRHPKDIDLLSSLLKKDVLLVLKECPFTEDKMPLVKDSLGKAYAHELVACLTKNNCINPSTEAFAAKNIAKTLRKPQIHRFAPLKDWLYLKIYLHPAGMNSLLLEKIDPFIARCHRAKLINNWHYLRYQDPEDHIRLRLYAPGKRMDKLLLLLRPFLTELSSMKNIRDVMVAAYQPEIEKYALAGMKTAEEIFTCSSAIALSEIAYADDFEGEYFKESHFLVCAVRLLCLMMKALAIEESMMITSALHKFDIFLKQNQHSGIAKREHDQSYRLLQDGFVLIQQEPPVFEPELRLLELLKTLHAEDAASKLNFLAEIFHMHINRQFSNNHKTHEALSFYFLSKYLKRPVAYR
ncbi:thiopeptide-type bacteriocin biosynthesis protein [Pedobacter glucosidilyticus]|uniref:thiopeptide-type bacteriocin biosynthesis protein n=1 Tax=Pedobacter glucosidilyticus TaxID=1122941 RepID=UPI0003F59B0F|nr:thiopeptide-type bacteriocin biosynthesis protein [Pedobacter glucosidilyticus]